MGDDVRFVLDFLQPGNPGRGVIPPAGHLQEKRSALFNLFGQRFKELKKTFFFREKTHVKNISFDFLGSA